MHSYDIVELIKDSRTRGVVLFVPHVRLPFQDPTAQAENTGGYLSDYTRHSLEPQKPPRGL